MAKHSVDIKKQAGATNTLSMLIASVLVLLLCCTCFLGTTYAWFTSSVSTGVSQIQSGQLELGLYMQTAKTADQNLTTTNNGSTEYSISNNSNFKFSIVEPSKAGEASNAKATQDGNTIKIDSGTTLTLELPEFYVKNTGGIDANYKVELSLGDGEFAKFAAGVNNDATSPSIKFYLVKNATSDASASTSITNNNPLKFNSLGVATIYSSDALANDNVDAVLTPKSTGDTYKIYMVVEAPASYSGQIDIDCLSLILTAKQAEGATDFPEVASTATELVQAIVDKPQGSTIRTTGLINLSKYDFEAIWNKATSQSDKTTSGESASSGSIEEKTYTDSNQNTYLITKKTEEQTTSTDAQANKSDAQASISATQTITYWTLVVKNSAEEQIIKLSSSYKTLTDGTTIANDDAKLTVNKSITIDGGLMTEVKGTIYAPKANSTSNELLVKAINFKNETDINITEFVLS